MAYGESTELVDRYAGHMALKWAEHSTVGFRLAERKTISDALAIQWFTRLRQ